MTLSVFFLICFLVGIGVSGVSLFASFAHLHHHGGFHFHHHGGGGNPLLKGGTTLISYLFNLAAITMFLAWFGGVGLLLEEMTKLTAAIVIVIACGAGGTGAATINRVIRALREREHPLQPITLVGTIGRVTIPIRAESGTGEVVYSVDGTRRCSGARSDDGRAIGKGSEVVITRYDKGIAYVCELERMLGSGETRQLTQ
jgi:membrane protein implicated in regulation of membrane protease activity